MSDGTSGECPHDAPGVFDEHRGLLVSVAYRVLGSVTDAEDTVQEAWLRWCNTPGSSATARSRSWHRSRTRAERPITKREKAAAEEPPSESRRTILFRCYPQPNQEGTQAERGIGLREPAQAAIGVELGAVEVGVEVWRRAGQRG